jgi:hypothetical protein
MAPNTQAAFYLAAAAEAGEVAAAASAASAASAEFNYDNAIGALAHITVANGNVIPLDGSQIARLKVHRDDDEEISGSRISTSTRDILLKALLHCHNTKESHADVQYKAAFLESSIAESDAKVDAAQQQLRRLEQAAAALKKSHTTLSHVLVCNRRKGSFGVLPRSTHASAKRGLEVVKPPAESSSEAASSSSESEDSSDDDVASLKANYKFSSDDDDDDV